MRSIEKREGREKEEFGRLEYIGDQNDLEEGGKRK